MRARVYWWDTTGTGHPDETTASRVPVPSTADVAIVGAGYTGLSAAATLARTGASVAVLERERVGWGASSRNAGQVLTGLRVGPAALIARYGAARARELFHDSLTAIDDLEALVAREGIACDYERVGHIQAASKPGHFAGFRDEQALLARVFNHQVTLVPASEQASELGSPAYHGLLVDNRSGAVNPARYADGLARVASRLGASIHEGAGVQRIERAGARWRVTTSAGAVDAAEVLLATDAYTDRSAPGLQRRLVPVGSHVIVTEPLGALAGRLLPKRRTAFDSKHFVHYFRLTADDRLLFGGRAEFRPAEADPIRAAAILRRDMAAVFPQLANVDVAYSWCGNVAFTTDEMPRAGRLDGLWYAAGYGGHGVAMATRLGALVARRIAGEALAHPLFDDHSRAIPFYDGRPWFLPILGAYFRFKDMVE